MELSQLKEWSIFHLLFAITFFTSGIIVNFIQCVLYLTLRHFSKHLYRKINYYLSYSIHSEMLFMSQWWSGSEVNMYIDADEFKKFYGKEHAYCVMNHKYEVDWLFGWQVAEQIGVLGNCKAYAKKSIQYLPVIGWAWKFSEFVFLERNYDKDKEIIGKQIVELANHPDPIWLLLFPEGTRFTKEKHEASLKFAKEHDLPILNHHLLPRTKGFLASLPHMHGKIDAIYDCQIAFKTSDPYEPTMKNVLFGKKLDAHLYMRRIPFDKVPTDVDAQTKFLYDMFERKDRMAAGFAACDDFFAHLPAEERVAPFKLPRRRYDLANMIFWVVVILIPMVYTLIRLFCSGELFLFSIASGLILIFYLLLYKALRMTDINKSSSSYGTSPKAKKQN